MLKGMIDFLQTRTKGDFGLVIVEVVIRVLPNKTSDGGIALQLNKAGIIIHFKGCFVSISYPPYSNDTDQDGIPTLVIDLYALAFKVAGAKGYGLFSKKWICPKEAVVFDSTLVLFGLMKKNPVGKNTMNNNAIPDIAGCHALTTPVRPMTMTARNSSRAR